MKGLFLEALVDSAGMIPFLLAVYFLVESFERRFGGTIRHLLQKTAKAGPVLGAAFGCVPQCGFSVVASALYSRRLIAPGTLLAVFLATSDEAVPVLLAAPGRGGVVGALLITKLIVGVVSGYAIDLAWGGLRGRGAGRPGAGRAELFPQHTAVGREAGLPGRRPAAPPVPVGALDGEPVRDERLPGGANHEPGCCRHGVSGGTGTWQWLVHPVVHTGRIFAFILLATLGIDLLIRSVGEANLGRALLRQSLVQPVLAALIGLVPNCAVSVAVAELYLKGGLSYGSTVAGLCSSGGLGVLVLLKENPDRRDTLRILLLLVGISAVVGIAIQLVYG
jgi:hypothetical protein